MEMDQSSMEADQSKWKWIHPLSIYICLIGKVYWQVISEHYTSAISVHMLPKTGLQS